MMISVKRVFIAVISLAAAVLAFIPVATRSLGGTTSGRAVTPAQCAQLRDHLRRPDMSCGGLTAYRLSARGKSVTLLARSVATSSGTYLTGWLQACSNQACTGWWVEDDFGVTVIAGAGAWNNWHSCSSSGTPVTWCGTWQNGGPIYMEEGFNFGNNGWARFRIDTSGRGSTTGSSYAVINGAV